MHGLLAKTLVFIKRDLLLEVQVLTIRKLFGYRPHGYHYRQPLLPIYQVGIMYQQPFNPVTDSVYQEVTLADDNYHKATIARHHQCSVRAN